MFRSGDGVNVKPVFSLLSCFHGIKHFLKQRTIIGIASSDEHSNRFLAAPIQLTTNRAEAPFENRA